jgi:hypothetical protein
LRSVTPVTQCCVSHKRVHKSHDRCAM